MNVRAISLDETRYFNLREEDKRWIVSIHSVYAYDPESGVHLCELAPSHELRYLYTFIRYADDVSEDKRAELDERYCYEGSEDIYVHVAEIRQRETKDCGSFEDWDEATEYLRGNCPI